jgi:WD40 repeat protein
MVGSVSGVIVEYAISTAQPVVSMMNRREFHRTVAATATGMALDGKLPLFAAESPTSLPTDPLPAGASARLGCNRLWHQWPASNPGLNDLTFSPDGRYLATLGYQDDHVFIWSVPDGRAVCDWEPQDADGGGDLLWTDKGLHVASNGGLSLWEPLTTSLIHRFTDDPLRGLSWSADGRLVAATSYFRGTVELWETATCQPVAQLHAEIDGKRQAFPGWGDFLLSASFSRCGRWLAAGGYGQGRTGCADGLVHFWDIALRRHLIRFFTNGGPVGRLAFTPTGSLLTADWAGSVSLWSVPEGRLMHDSPRPERGSVDRGLSANASGQVAIQRPDGVRLWHADPSREIALCPARGSSNLAYSDDGRFVAVGARSGRVDLYDALTGADLSPPDRHAARVGRIEFTADGTICLACLGYPGPHHVNEVVLRDTRTGVRLKATPPPDWRPLSLAPVGTRIAGRLSESRLAVWDWASGDLKVHPELDPRAVAWHPDGQTLAILATNGEVVTWHAATDGGKRQPVSSPAPIVALAAVGECGVALSDEGELFVWQLDRDHPPRRIAVPLSTPKHNHHVAKWLLSLAPDGLAAAVTCGDGIVYAGAVTGDELRAVYTHAQGDEDSQDGHTVVARYAQVGRLLIAGVCTALRDSDWWYTPVVTDGISGEVVWRSPPQLSWPTALALSPDGQSLLTGHEDGTLLVWPLGPGSKGATSRSCERPNNLEQR